MEKGSPATDASDADDDTDDDPDDDNDDEIDDGVIVVVVEDDDDDDDGGSLEGADMGCRGTSAGDWKRGRAGPRCSSVGVRWKAAYVDSGGGENRKGQAGEG